LTDQFIATRVASVVGSHANYQAGGGAGGAFSRITFPGAESGNFNGVSVWQEVGASGAGVSLGNQRIALLADDRAADRLVDRDLNGVADDVNGNGIPGQTGVTPAGDQVPGLANKIATAIQSAFAGAATVPLTTRYSGPYVWLSRGSVIIPPGVQIGSQGSGPGGTITGLATVNGTMYAVSDQGGLYRVNIPSDFRIPATATYITSSANDLLGIHFSGLTGGPPHVEHAADEDYGPYADMLFATDTSGSIYAFDTSGVLQPIFADGDTSVSTGLTNVVGLAFSTLDENLFHETADYPHYESANSMDVRLGLAAREGDPIWVDERQGDSGHENWQFYTNSYHFGQGNVNGSARSYDFPGGAYGSMVSNAFSLKGYAAADRPTLYFSYFLNTEGDDSGTGTSVYDTWEMMRDAFRVYVSDAGGDWQLLTTNNSYVGPGYVDDELVDLANPFDVQETFDVSDWRQVRVDLGPYAGRANLRLRIDFSTGGNMGLGDATLSGFELRAVSGATLRDGDTVVIDNKTLEFDSGLTLVAPTGAAIATAPTGEQITITDASGHTATLQFVDDVLTTSNLVATDGSALHDGDTFQISDGTTTKTFEFDSGYLIEVPAAGSAGLTDRSTFTVDIDGAGINLPLTFEFDKNGAYIDADNNGTADNNVINIADNLTLVVPAGGGAAINDQDRFALRRVTSGGTIAYTFEFDKNGVLSSPYNRSINIANNLTITLPTVGGGFGGVQDGEWFSIDPDGTAGLQPPIVFQFVEEGSAQPIFGNATILFNHFTTQDDLANRVVAAIQSQAGAVKVTPKNGGGGVVVLDGTTTAHRLVVNSPACVSGFRALTQLEVAERAIAAMDRVDGVDGTVLGLTLPNAAAGGVVNGNIVFGGTTPAHQLDTSGSFTVTQTTTARTANEVANVIATAINQAVQANFFGSTLRATGLAGGLVHVFDLIGGVSHTVDVTGAPGLTLRGAPDVTSGNVAVPFLPTDTVDQIINGAPAEVPGGLARPGLIQVINGSGLQVIASQAAYPNEEVVVLTGTAGNTVRFSPGVTALATQDVIPLYVDDTQTPNEVAGRIAQGVLQAVARGLLVDVAPHLNGDLGYEEPSIDPGAVRTNRVNLEGATQVVLSLGAASAFVLEGVVGVNDPADALTHALVPFNSDMLGHKELPTDPDGVAEVLDSALETLFHNPTIVTDNGSQFADGDTFMLSDGITEPAVFEFDSGFVLQIPLGGGNVVSRGVEDGESFTITDPSGTVAATFEFDKNGSVLAGSRAIMITESASALSVAKATVAALQASPLRTLLGLRPRLLSGNRVQVGGATGTTLAISPGSAVTQLAGEPGMTPEQILTLPQTLGMQLPDPLTIHVPAGGFVDGETFTLDDGVLPPVTFELEDLNFNNGVAPGNVLVGFRATSTPEDIARNIVAAINTSGLTAQATMLGGTGNIDLGCSPNFVLTLPATGPVLQTGPWALQAPVAGGAAITDGDQFTITNLITSTVYTYEFEDDVVRDGVTLGAVPIRYLPSDSQATLGDRIKTVLQATPGLYPEVTTGDLRVHLGAASGLVLDTSLTHLSQTGRSDGIRDGDMIVVRDGGQIPARTVQFEVDLNNTYTPGRVIIDVAPGSTPLQIAQELVHEIDTASLGLLPEYEGDGRIHVGGTSNHALSILAGAGPQGITQFGSGGALPDGQTFLVNELGTSVLFEFDSNGTYTPGSIRIVFTDDDSTATIADQAVIAMSSASSGLNIFPRDLGLGKIDLGGDDRHGLTLNTNLTIPTTAPTPPTTWQLTVPAAGGGMGGVVDGETFTISTAGTDYVFEFDNNTATQPGRYAIDFSFTATQNDVANSLVDAVGNIAPLGLAPRYLGSGLVDLGATALTHTLSVSTTVLTKSGQAGLLTPHVPVYFSPSDDYTAADVATTIAASINNTLGLGITASAGGNATADQRRVELISDNGLPTDITFTPDARGVLQLETSATDVFKQHEDLVRIINHTVTDPGPLGYEDLFPDNLFTANFNRWNEDTYLTGDAMGGFLSPARSQRNVYEGVYVDDFIIGFAERGESVSDAQVGGTAFGTNPGGSVSTGEYQLEIRRGPSYTSPLVNPLYNRSLDTNDRQAEGTTLVVKTGGDIADGQIFTISDGVRHVVFEYVDTTIVGNAAEAGRITVPFAPSEADYVIAQRVRDLINGPDVQAVLDVTASMADGTIQGAGTPPSTSARVNLFGSVTLEVNATTVTESDDSLPTATATGINSVDSPSYIATGDIGDNQNFPLNPGLDVDLFQVSLAAGDTLLIDIDASKIGSELDAYLRVFDATGAPVINPLTNLPYASDDDVAPGELPRLDPYLEFTAPASGVYYLGISGVNLVNGKYNADDNIAYDPLVPGSGVVSGTTGFYEIKLTFGAPTGTDMILYHDIGDSNQFRDQGQLLIEGNTILQSAQYGIKAQAGNRTGQDGDIPHTGPVRNLPKLNAENLTPGVVIVNNVLAGNQTGGILFAGDPNANLATEQMASVPFGRIVNNTVYGDEANPTGVGITVQDYASPTLLNNIMAGLATGISVDASSRRTATREGTVIGGTVYQGNTRNTTGVGVQDFPIYLAATDPLFRDADAGNFYPAELSPIIDSSVGSLLERFDFKQVKNTVGIADSPILAPDTDVTGQLRVDDPTIESPAGFGENVFIDRGAVDRSDFVGPTIAAVNPQDNDADGVDQNPAPGVVVLSDGAVFSSFQIRLLDGVPPADPNLGSGVDDATVTSATVVVTRDGVRLTDGIDYSFSYNTTSDTIFITPLSGIWASGHLYQVLVNNADLYRIVPKAGELLPDGASFLITDTDGLSATFEFESGYTLVVPQTLRLIAPEEGGGLGGVADGEIFTISRLVGTAVQKAVFEFDNNGIFTDNNRDGVADNFLVPFTVASTADDVADAIVGAINQANSLMSLGLSPRNLGKGVVHLGSASEHDVDVTRARSLTKSGQSGSVRDGDSFSVDDGTRLVTFEFDSNGQPIDANGDGKADHPGATLIAFASAQTNDEIAAAIALAVNVAKVGLDARAIGSGQVHFGGTANVHRITLANQNLTLLGTPGVRQAWGLRIPSTAGVPRFQDDGSGKYLKDGDTFTISDGTRLITFELDNLDDPVGGGFTTSPNIRVSYRQTSTLDQIADAVVAAIQNAPLASVKPVNAGHGVVLFGEPLGTPSVYTLDVTRSGLAQVGQPGVAAAIPVAISPAPAFDGAQVAVQVLAAINGSELAVRAETGGGDVVLVRDAVAVSEITSVFVSSQLLLGVKDRAGNLLKPNMLSGDTKLTFELGSVQADFGDAPETTGGSYPTTLGLDGPVHIITSDPLRLGLRVDSESDGLVSADADGDDVDGAGFIADTSGTPNMTQSSPNGMLPTILQLPEPLTLHVSDGATIQDGLTQFRITNEGVTVTFEFDNNNTLTNASNVRVPFTPSSTVEQIADTVVAMVKSRTDLKLSPANLGAGQVHIGGDVLTKVGSDVALSVSGTAHPIKDTDQEKNTFSISRPGGSGTITYTFEFEDTDRNDGVAAGHIPVPFDDGTTQDGYAEAVIAAVLDTPLGIAATNFQNGQVELNGNDEYEDGVLIGAFNPQTVTQIVVSANGPDIIDPITGEVQPWIGLLDAWIDFNLDGDFNDPGEQIFASQQLQRGDNAFEVAPAPDTRYGTTIGRFRISTAGGLKPTGLAADGEVEDHAVNIVAGTPPQTQDDAFLTSEDTVLNGSSLLANDSVDPGSGAANAAALHVANFQAVSELGATVIVDTTTNPATRGTFTYDPRGASVIQALDAGQTLTDTFTYRAMDLQFLSAPATVTLTIVGVNDNPVAVNDTQWSTNQNSPITIYVLTNDSDPEGQALTVTSVAGGIGTVAVNATQTAVRYDPTGKFNALSPTDSTTDQFTYTVSDGHGGTATATVVVTVTGLNDPPVGVTDVSPAARTNEDAPTTISVLVNDYDPEGGSLTVTAVQLGGTKGVAMVNTPGTPGNTVTYNPNGKFDYLAVGETGIDVFRYIVQDLQGASSVGTVSVTIEGRNDQPVAYSDTASVPRNQTVSISVLSNDRDADTSDVLEVLSAGSLSTKGTFTISGDKKSIVYNPNGQFNYLAIGQSATDRFTYTLTDGHGGTSSTTVTVTVTGASDPPVAVNDTATTTEDQAVQITVLANDTDDLNQKQVVAVDTTGLLGTVTINPAGQWNNYVIYSPNGQFEALADNQTATEIFRYTVSDGTGSAVGTVTVTIRGANDAPIANVDANNYTVQRGKTLTANDASGTLTPGVPGDDGVLFNDADAEGDALRAQLVTGPAHATSFTLNANGTFTYRNDGSAATFDTFAYRAVDSHNAASAQTVTVVISIVDAPPAAWQNPIIHTDVNNDGVTSPMDALLLINYINAHTGDPQLPPTRPVGAYYYDANGDGLATAADVLVVINRINQQNAAGGEGEASPAASAGDYLVATPRVTASPAATAIASSPVAKSTAAKPAAVVTIDKYGIDDILGEIADDVNRAQPENSPLDDVLNEMLV
jgi:VCBS repeat-containing protein